MDRNNFNKNEKRNEVATLCDLYVSYGTNLSHVFYLVSTSVSGSAPNHS